MNLSVKEIKQKLLDLGLDDREIAMLKSKDDLLSKLKDMEALELESLTKSLLETEEQLAELESEEELTEPEYGDPGWQEYVLSFFHENELYDNKYPTLNGMRRVSQKLLGDLEYSGIVSLNASMPDDNNGRAYCTYELVFSDFLGKGRRVFRASADAHQYNMNDTYCIYPVAIAENRSEVRAYRKALMLSVVGAEEMKDNNVTHFESILSNTGSNEKMTSMQELIIKTRSEPLNIDTSKILKDGMSKQEAANLIQLLNTYQSDTNKIPQEIKL